MVEDRAARPPARRPLLRQKPAPPKKLLERIREALEIDRQARATAGQRAVVLDGIASKEIASTDAEDQRAHSRKAPARGAEDGRLLHGASRPGGRPPRPDVDPGELRT